MQQLPKATKLTGHREACAGALLGVLPGLMRFVRHHMRSRRAAGLSVPQFRMLVQLYHRPSASLSVVAEALGSTAPAASRLVSGLVRRGFVVRQESSSDRRQISLALTTAGRSAMKAAWSGTQQVLAEQLGTLSGSQLDELTRSLAVLSSVFGCIADPAAGAVPDPAANGSACRRSPKTASRR